MSHLLAATPRRPRPRRRAEVEQTLIAGLEALGAQPDRPGREWFWPAEGVVAEFLLLDDADDEPDLLQVLFHSTEPEAPYERDLAVLLHALLEIAAATDCELVDPANDVVVEPGDVDAYIAKWM